MMPLPYRWLTSLLLRCDGSNLLIDCGEGTQIALKEKAWSPKPIDTICFTHFHADHCSGLPGLLLTMGNAERTEPLTLVGPKGLERVVEALRTIAPELPFDLRYIELSGVRERIERKPYVIEAFRVNHRVTCYGYAISIPRKGRFDAARAKELGIPLQFWNRLQKGETIAVGAEGDDVGPGAVGTGIVARRRGKTDGGEKTDGGAHSGATAGHMIYTPDMVMGEARRGLKVTYVTDTRPVPIISEYAADADLFICEGMYGEPDKEAKAREHMHMTFVEAAKLAARAKPQPRQMWLTHYSPSLLHPEEFMGQVREIFPRAYPGKDAKTAELRFEDEE
jgi:ribonuclease Z